MGTVSLGGRAGSDGAPAPITWPHAATAFPDPSAHLSHALLLGPYAVQCLALLLALALAFKLAVVIFRYSTQRTTFNYVPYSGDPGLKGVLVTDCTHPKARTLTHHKGSNNPVGLKPSDTSTGLVLNALRAGVWSGFGQVYQFCQTPAITTNHFDVDSFLSVWCYLNRQLAAQHDGVLRHMSRIGDFREAFISPEMVSAHGHEDNIVNIRDAFTALKLCCWLNSVERRRFSGPYEAKDCAEKFAFLLPRFASVLADPEAAWQDWQDEYKEVVSGYDALGGAAPEGLPPPVERHPSIGLAILRPPVSCDTHLHYYSLFSHTVGADVVLVMYSGQRYELECKYTQFVAVHSRRVFPRFDMAPLARVLNQVEGRDLPATLRWTCPRLTDTGPILRIEDVNQPLSKAQRYGHPSRRPIHASTLPQATMAALVRSFLEFGMAGLKPKRGGWSWEALQALNARLNWQQWEDTVIAQWWRGELTPPGAAGGLPSPHLARRSGDAAGVSGPDGLSGLGSLSRQGSASAQALAGMPGAPRVGQAMSPGGFWHPVISEPSTIMSSDDVGALAGAVPARLQGGRWRLVYSSARDGISLNTLYRKAAGRSPTLLVVREAGSGGHVFGAYASEPWKVGPRFYGTGETFVFQLFPVRKRFSWQRVRHAGALGAPLGGGSRSSGGGGDGDAATANNFFQFSTHEGLGVGGAGHFAIWLDNELLEGASHECDTFGSPGLASKEEFHVAVVELWQL